MEPGSRHSGTDQRLHHSQEHHLFQHLAGSIILPGPMHYNLNRVTAVVLAGGLGTRIQALFPDLPKPMIPVLGKPFLEWVIRFLRKQGFERAIISSGYRAEVVERYFAPQP